MNYKCQEMSLDYIERLTAYILLHDVDFLEAKTTEFLF